MTNWTCCVPSCTSRHRRKGPLPYKFSGRTFHKIPLDPQRRNEWLVRIRRFGDEAFKINDFTRVCSAHFRKEDFRPILHAKLGRKYLKYDAVPSIFSWNDDAAAATATGVQSASQTSKPCNIKDTELKDIEKKSKPEELHSIEKDISEEGKNSSLTISECIASPKSDKFQSSETLIEQKKQSLSKCLKNEYEGNIEMEDSPKSKDKSDILVVKGIANKSESNLVLEKQFSPSTDDSSPSVKDNEVVDSDVSLKSIPSVQVVDSPSGDKSDSSEKILGISPKCEFTPTTDETSSSEKGKIKDALDSGKEKKSTASAEVGMGSDDKQDKSEKSPSSATTGKSTSEHKKGDGEKKKKKNKTCEECKAKKGLKFQVLFQGKTRFLCSDECFKNFKEKQKQSKPSPLAEQPSMPKPVVPVVPDVCGNCKKTVTAGAGYYPEVGEIRAMCSDDCVKKYEENKHPPKMCSQCKKGIEDRHNYLTWETMAFCNEDCLGKYQSFLGSQCTCCQAPVQQSSLGKYCVCFGSDIKQFCSGSCLEEFKKSLKVCTFCQTDLSSVDAFLAPVGEKGSFKDFCSQPCMVQYEVMNKKLDALAKVHDCAQCGKQGTFKIVIKYEDKWHGLCSSQCVGGFRYTNKIKLNVCETCCRIIQPETELKYTLTHEGMHKNFCTRPCMTLYTLSNRKIVPCVTCKVKKYNFDMIEKYDKTEPSKVFCSLNCLSLYRVSLNVTSSKCVRCDHCTKNLPAQYHLTMSDGSVRNFCNYPCVVMFQGQFPNVPALTNTTSSRPSSTGLKTASGTPVISNVMSLATQPQPRTMTQSTAAKLVSQKLNPRNPGSPIGMPSTKSQGSSPSYPSTPSSTITSSSANSQIIREVIIKPPAPKSVKNKTVACKPIIKEIGISCKPPNSHKAVQTDDRPLPFLLPFPLPVYIPTPVQMFSRPVPVPIPFGIPIPFPIILQAPAAKETPNQVAADTHDSKEKAPTATIQAEVSKISENGSKDLMDLPPSLQKVLSDQEDEYVFKDASDIQSKKRSISSGIANEKGEKRAKTNDCSNERPSEEHDFPQAIPEEEDQNLATCQNENLETFNTRLKYIYGVNAWKQWVLLKNAHLLSESKKYKIFKTDPLELPPDELNYSLCLFLRELKKPDGEDYGSGSMYYLCLGIQHYLNINGRMDNLFTETHYATFVDKLHTILLEHEIMAPSEGLDVTRIEEEILWEAKQLGAYSPYALMNTLMYYNTKYLKLRTVDDHKRLAFTHFSKYKKDGSYILRYYPSFDKNIPRRSKDESAAYEQTANNEDTMRCPVMLYEFYLSKCPESIKTRNDVFYLETRADCTYDRNIWYTKQPMASDALMKILQRIKLIREAHT